MPYEFHCQGATSAPVITGDVVDACTTAGGSVSWVESAGFLPELSLADGGAIAAAILGLWALGFCLGYIRRQLWES